MGSTDSNWLLMNINCKLFQIWPYRCTAPTGQGGASDAAAQAAPSASKGVVLTWPADPSLFLCFVKEQALLSRVDVSWSDLGSAWKVRRQRATEPTLQIHHWDLSMSFYLLCHRPHLHSPSHTRRVHPLSSPTPKACGTRTEVHRGQAARPGYFYLLLYVRGYQGFEDQLGRLHGY